MSATELSTADQERLIAELRSRFLQNLTRHAGVDWEIVERRLRTNTAALTVLHKMEITGGEPDVVGSLCTDGSVTFVDCSPESPKGRRSLCYDGAALESRKEHKPVGSAVESASSYGARLLDEEQYQWLQTFGEFDLKTSSWLKTTPEMRKLGGAIFGDRRFDRVFIYHNGAESYYASRGFRCLLKA